MQPNTMQQPKIHAAVRGGTPPLSEAEFDSSFRPKGAIAFFILMVILGLIIWFGIYFLMLERV